MAKGATASVVDTGKGVGFGALAGIILGMSVSMFGPLLGNIIGAVGAGMVHKTQRDVIALIAGMNIAQSMGGGTAGASASAANDDIM